MTDASDLCPLCLDPASWSASGPGECGCENGEGDG